LAGRESAAFAEVAVDLVAADGGFELEGYKNAREINWSLRFMVFLVTFV
jgi:hypothetical protein